MSQAVIQHLSTMTLDIYAGCRLPGREAGRESLPSTEVDLIWIMFRGRKLLNRP